VVLHEYDCPRIDYFTVCCLYLCLCPIPYIASWRLSEFDADLDFGESQNDSLIRQQYLARIDLAGVLRARMPGIQPILSLGSCACTVYTWLRCSFLLEARETGSVVCTCRRTTGGIGRKSSFNMSTATCMNVHLHLQLVPTKTPNPFVLVSQLPTR
jgi:hypothetical protein